MPPVDRNLDVAIAEGPDRDLYPIETLQGSFTLHSAGVCLFWSLDML